LLEKGKDYSKMKVIDFGTAKNFDLTGKKKLNERIGTPFYIAPEVLKREYNEKCDIWSIGVITYMLLSGRAPFFGNTDEEIYEGIKKGKCSMDSETW
jgi:calcium-dependent protein kinase